MADKNSKTAGLLLIFVVSIVFLILSLVNYDFIVLAVISLIIGLVMLLRGGGKVQRKTGEMTKPRMVSHQVIDHIIRQLQLKALFTMRHQTFCSTVAIRQKNGLRKAVWLSLL